LTSLPTDNAFTQASQVIASFFGRIQAGRHSNQNPWTSFQLVRGEYEEIERLLRQYESLLGFVKEKIGYAVSGWPRKGHLII
jgi:hypothetical protein